MSIEQFQIPEAIAARYPNWRAIVAEKCPLTMTALHYAIDKSLNFQFKSVDSRKITGEADLVDKTVQIFYSDDMSIAKFFGIVGHEINHIRQAYDVPEFFEWDRMIADLDRSFALKWYAMKDSYRLPRVQDDLFLAVAMEYDSCIYGDVVEEECRSVLDPNGKQSFFVGEIAQTKLNHYCIGMLGAPKLRSYLIDSLMKKQSQVKTNWIKSLAVFNKIYGKLPAIEWIDVMVEDVQKMMTGFWPANSYVFPLSMENNKPRLQRLKEETSLLQPAEELTRQAQEVFAGRVPTALFKARPA